MCGIIGCVGARARPFDGGLLARLESGTRALRHRGPDDEGYLLLGEGRECAYRGADTIAALGHLPMLPTGGAEFPSYVALGFRRLAIIDLSAAGHMPMRDRETGNWLVLNGEIYNYRELREQLRGLGHVFVSASDSEVLLKAYRQWGQACLERLNGMWAFALWDQGQQELFCARDRFGEKQLYYGLDADRNFWFASEIRPLRRQLARGVDEGQIWDFLVYGMADHLPETLHRGIEQLLPGHCLAVQPGMAPRARRYYEAAPRPCAPGVSAAALVEEFRRLLLDSVALRLRSDVPVASFLSGGLDSSSVVAMGEQILREQGVPGRLHTFTNGYASDSSYDETPLVRAALSGWRCVDAHFHVGEAANLEQELPKLVAAQELPFHNLSILASFLLLRQIGRHHGMRVVLTGEAGDELLGGYVRVHTPVYLSQLLWGGHWIRWWQEAQPLGWKRSLAYSARGAARSLPARLRLRALRRSQTVPGLMQPDFLYSYAEREERWQAEWHGGSLRQRLLGDLTRFNLPQLLRHVDRNAMHSSVETRVPFLDHRLVEFALGLPDAMRIHKGYSKYILRLAMERQLPPAIVWNRKKLGFGMAEQFWFPAWLPKLPEMPGMAAYLQIARWPRRLANGEVPDQSLWLPLSIGLWLQECHGAGQA